MSYIVEVKKREMVKVGERVESTYELYNRQPSTIPIIEERITPVLRQEVDVLNLQELVKLLNGIV